LGEFVYVEVARAHIIEMWPLYLRCFLQVTLQDASQLRRQKFRYRQYCTSWALYYWSRMV